MTGKEYQELAGRTNDGNHTTRLVSAVFNPDYRFDINVAEVVNGCLGLTGETGEFADMIKKWIFHEKELDADHAKKEVGDIMWYIAMICKAFQWNLDEIMQMNIDKLKARYPEGFDTNLSNNRKSGDV